MAYLKTLVAVCCLAAFADAYIGGFAAAGGGFGGYGFPHMQPYTHPVQPGFPPLFQGSLFPFLFNPGNIYPNVNQDKPFPEGSFSSFTFTSNGENGFFMVDNNGKKQFFTTNPSKPGTFIPVATPVQQD